MLVFSSISNIIRSLELFMKFFKIKDKDLIKSEDKCEYIVAKSFIGNGFNSLETLLNNLFPPTFFVLCS